MTVEGADSQRQETLWRQATGRVLRSQSARVAGGALLLLVLAALLGPALSPHDAAGTDWQAVGVAPTLERQHWLGTDRLGRDLFVRTLEGLRMSLGIGVMAALISIVIGTAVGTFAGYAGGRRDAFIMRVVDVLYAVPYLLFVILLTVVAGRDPWLLFAAIGAIGWLSTARIVRSEARALMQREFVAAAIACGAGPARVVLRHLWPNVAGLVVVQATLTVPQMILAEGFLSFLGLGVQEPLASLGNLIADGAIDMETAPWMLLAPAVMLFALVLALNLVGDALRNALDPRVD
ncbi:MAG: ABC transporter permease [Gammaproteobacteria bacterium]|nr:ABC transporter permease [Gammaproteobacteria bacterium]